MLNFLFGKNKNQALVLVFEFAKDVNQGLLLLFVLFFFWGGVALFVENVGCNVEFVNQEILSSSSSSSSFFFLTVMFVTLLYFSKVT